MDPRRIEERIRAALPGAEVQVSGDGRHFQARVVSAAFAGKSPVACHRMVYAALGEEVGSEALHALSLRTYTPEQWARLGR